MDELNSYVRYLGEVVDLKKSPALSLRQTFCLIDYARRLECPMSPQDHIKFISMLASRDYLLKDVEVIKVIRKDLSYFIPKMCEILNHEDPVVLNFVPPLTYGKMCLLEWEIGQRSTS